MLSNKKIAILIGPQFHDEETTQPKEFLMKLGAVVDIVGLDDSTLTGKYGRVTLKPDKTITEIKPQDYDGMIIPGGGAPERIRVNDAALEFVKAFWATGRPVGAICHGPQVLISARLRRSLIISKVLLLKKAPEGSAVYFSSIRLLSFSPQSVEGR